VPPAGELVDGDGQDNEDASDEHLINRRYADELQPVAKAF
jgi:hypothetical protein